MSLTPCSASSLRFSSADDQVRSSFKRSGLSTSCWIPLSQGSKPSHTNLGPLCFYQTRLLPPAFSSSKLISADFFSQAMWSGVWPRSVVNVMLMLAPASRSCCTFLSDCFSQAMCSAVQCDDCCVGSFQLFACLRENLKILHFSGSLDLILSREHNERSERPHPQPLHHSSKSCRD